MSVDMIATVRERAESLRRSMRPLTQSLEAITAKSSPSEADLRRSEALIGELEPLREELRACEERERELLTVLARRTNARLAPVRVERSNTSGARAQVYRNIEATRHADDRALSAAFDLLDSNDGEQVARSVGSLSDPDYLAAFLKMMRDPERGHLEWTDNERRAYTAVTDERRAMSVGTNSAGGYAVPFLLDPNWLITGTGSINPMRQLATVKTVPVGTWHGVAAAQITASWDLEASAVSDDSPTLAQPTIPTYLGRAFIPVSFEAFNDVVDLASEVMTLMADAKDNLEASAHFVGSGTNQPTGIVTAANAVTASRVSPATGGAIALADAFTVQSALPARFSKAASWASNIAIINKFRQLAMAQNSANSVWTDMGQDAPAGFLGRGYFEASTMDSAITTGSLSLIYGDFTKYHIVDVAGSPTMEYIPNLSDPSTGRPTSQRGFMLWWRQGADLVDPNAVRLLKL